MNFLKNKFACFLQGPDYRVRIIGAPFPIFIVNKKSVAARRLPRGHIPPPISDHETAREVYLPLVSRLDQHSRFGLAAIATVRIRVITHLNVIT